MTAQTSHDISRTRQAVVSGVAADLIDLILPLWQRDHAEPGQGAGKGPSGEAVDTTLALAQLWDMVAAWERFATMKPGDRT